ncbi:hypothetical protein HHK36_019386 [Tetracentron sinense]|uniref:RRM domain-containing protein n=1 Tax=Tetracentron sinense TaxID=13715 RepID=A0A834YX96_TETSI|nr:hypothetical protein HHK36_019386 [Tetracentron sinense]
MMDMFFSSSHTSPFSPSILAGKSQSLPSSLVFSAKSSPESDPPRLSGNVRRPKTLKISPSKSIPPNPNISSNPLRNLVNPSKPPNNSDNLATKLWLSSKISPPPPPPPPPPLPETFLDLEEKEARVSENSGSDHVPGPEFRQEGKIFVGNLPLWIKKNEVAEFFRQFGPIKNVVLIKGHDDPERNVGYGFIIYGGPTAVNSATKAVEFDGVEFHGRVLTVKMDDGRRLKSRSEERARWLEGSDGVEFRSKWHEERESSRREFRKVVETEPENWQAVVRSFERIKKPSRREFGLMVNYYARRGDMHRAREVFESMRARGIEPTSHVFTNLIHAYAVGRDMEEALSCVRKMKEEGIEMSLVTYSILVGGFSKIGNTEYRCLSGIVVYRYQCASAHAIPDLYHGIFLFTHTVLRIKSEVLFWSLVVLCQTCNMDRAEALVREMEEEGIDAPIGIYHTMMDGYTNIGDEDKCLIVFERLKECGFTPSVISYGCLINIYSKMGKVSKALEVSRIMESCGIKHNMKTYSMLINGFLILKDWANAYAIFEDVVNAGLKPDVVLYNNIIKAFCGAGNLDRAIRTVEEMQKERHRPTSRTFMPIIHGFAKSGEMRRALEIFNMMRRSGCIPTVHTFNALILGLVEKLQMEKAVQILDEMSLAGITPNEHTYTTIMHGYASLGDTGKAFEYFSKVKNEGLELDVFSYQALLKACCKAGRMQSALAVTREMSARNIPRNTFVYNILIDGWARRGDVWEAADLMQQMKQEGVQPDIHTYTSFINACCKAGDMLRATKTIEEMEAVGVNPNIKTYTTLIHGWARASLPEKALRCFEDMKLAGLKPDKAVYHCLMTSLLSRATVAEDYIYSGVVCICREMVEIGLTVDMGTAVHWSKCLRKIERTGGELTEALQKTFPPAWNSFDILEAKWISGLYSWVNLLLLIVPFALFEYLKVTINVVLNGIAVQGDPLVEERIAIWRVRSGKRLICRF